MFWIAGFCYTAASYYVRVTVRFLGPGRGAGFVAVRVVELEIGGRLGFRLKQP